MTLTHFIPELWSASILENFRRDTVLVGMANREYEKAFTAGSKIHIPGIVDVKVKDYKTGAVTASGGTKVPRTTVPDAVESTGIANPTNWETAYAAILKLRGKLSAEKVPAMDRVLLINAAFEEFLLSDGSKLTSFDKSNMTDGLREATIGRLLGFDVVTSPWLDNTKPMAVAFHKPSVAYVSQVEKTESMRAEQTFADRVRGLHVYGGAVLRPKAIQVFKAA